MNSLPTYLTLFLILFLAIGCGKSEMERASETHSESKRSVDKLLLDVDADSLSKIILSYKGDKAVLVNIWATWCIPCVEEFPEIVKIQEMYESDLQVVFVSADFPEDRQRAEDFLEKNNVNWTTYFKDAKDEPFINALSKDWSGALPFTKIINKMGKEVAHWENKASFDKFNISVKQAI